MSISFGTWDITGGIADGGSDVHNKGYYSTSSALIAAQSTAQPGDYAIVGETSTVWVWDENAGTWVDTDTKGEVSSVNGKTGTVVLTAEDVGAVYTGGKNILVNNNNIISADQYPLFTVNSGNLNAQGEGDLIGDISYDNISSDSFTYKSSDTNISRSGNIITATVQRSFYSNSSTPLIPNDKPWEIACKMVYPSKSSAGISIGFSSCYFGNEYMGKVSGISAYAALFTLNRSSSTNYSFVIKTDGYNTSAVVENYTGFQFYGKTFWLKVGWNGEQYYIKGSFDGESYQTLVTYGSTNPSPTCQLQYRVNNVNNPMVPWIAFCGSLYLEEWYLSVEGQEVWRAVDSINTVNSMSFKVGGNYPSIQATTGQGEQFTVDELADQTLSGYADGTYNVFLTPEGITYANTGVVYVQNAAPIMSANDIWFNTSVYPYKVVQSDGVTEFTDIPICKLTIETQANGSVVVKNSETYPYNRSTLFPMFTSTAVEFMTLEQNG